MRRPGRAALMAAGGPAGRISNSVNAGPAETRPTASRLVAPAAELAVTVGTLRDLVALGDVDLRVTRLAVEVAGLLGPLAGLGHHVVPLLRPAFAVEMPPSSRGPTGAG